MPKKVEDGMQKWQDSEERWKLLEKVSNMVDLAWLEGVKHGLEAAQKLYKKEA